MEDWQNNGWINFLLFSNYYSEQNERDSLIVQNWDNNEWQNKKRNKIANKPVKIFIQVYIIFKAIRRENICSEKSSGRYVPGDGLKYSNGKKNHHHFSIK